MLKLISIAVIALSIGVYVYAVLSPSPALSVVTVEKLNLVHLATLYLAIVLYVINSIRRVPFASPACVLLLLVSSYTGVVVEVWRFVGVTRSFIPPFLFVLTCAESTRALCNHFSSIEISVPLITAFVSLCWGVYKLASSLRRGVSAGRVENGGEIDEGLQTENLQADSS